VFTSGLFHVSVEKTAATEPTAVRVASVVYKGQQFKHITNYNNKNQSNHDKKSNPSVAGGDNFP